MSLVPGLLSHLDAHPTGITPWIRSPVKAKLDEDKLELERDLENLEVRPASSPSLPLGDSQCPVKGTRAQVPTRLTRLSSAW